MNHDSPARKAARARLPCEECRGKCCTYAPIETKVWERVKHKVPEGSKVIKRWEGTRGEAYIAMKPGTDGVCAFLTDEGRCSIYTYRPMSCRAVGVDPRAPCPEVDPEGSSRATARALREMKARGRVPTMMIPGVAD